jgi:hypothetical protein
MSKPPLRVALSILGGGRRMVKPPDTRCHTHG